MTDISEGKQLLNAGLGTLSMVAFAFPGGAPIGVALLVMEGVFDALLGDPPPPPNLDITRVQLKEAVDAVKAQIIDAIWKGQEDDITDEMLAQQQGFLEVYAAMSKLKMDGERYVLSTTNDTVTNFIANTDAYFDMTKAVMPKGILTLQRGFRNFLEPGSRVKLNSSQEMQHQIVTMGLYGLIGSLTCAYLKTAVLWNWGRELLMAWQYKQYLVALGPWTQMTPQEQANNPTQNPVKMYPGVDTDPSYKTPTWEGWKTPNTCPANLLIEEVDDMLNYCVVGTTSQTAMYPTILNKLTDLDTKLSAGNAGLAYGAVVTKAQMINAVEQGAKAAGWMQVLIPQLGFDKTTEADVLDFGKTLDGWRAAKASVSFTTHPVVKAGETLTTIAQTESEYKGEDPAVFAQKLYKANPGLKFVGPAPANGDWTGIAIVNGSIVKIFKKDAFTYLPIAQGGTQ